MPVYKLPKVKKPAKAKKPSADIVAMDNSYLRRLHLPVNAAIVDAVDVDDKVSVTVKAVVTGVEKVERAEGRGRAELTLDMDSIAVTVAAEEKGDPMEEFGKELASE